MAHVNREPSLLSALNQPLPFHLLLSVGKFFPDSVPTYSFTLGLTQQSSVRSSKPSVHATCSRNCGRGHLQTRHVAEHTNHTNPLQYRIVQSDWLVRSG